MIRTLVKRIEIDNDDVEIVYRIDDLPTPILQTFSKKSNKFQSGKSSLGAPGVPFVPIEESIHPDYIVCLEDGKRLKMLKRHLKTAYGMIPEQ